MREENSAISVAFADSVLRTEGLAGDTYGDAKHFFALDNSQLHHLLCYCHYGATQSADRAAHAVRGVLAVLTRPPRLDLASRMQRWWSG